VGLYRAYNRCHGRQRTEAFPPVISKGVNGDGGAFHLTVS